MYKTFTHTVTHTHAHCDTHTLLIDSYIQFNSVNSMHTSQINSQSVTSISVNSLINCENSPFSHNAKTR